MGGGAQPVRTVQLHEHAVDVLFQLWLLCHEEGQAVFLFPLKLLRRVDPALVQDAAGKAIAEGRGRATARAHEREQTWWCRRASVGLGDRRLGPRRAYRRAPTCASCAQRSHSLIGHSGRQPLALPNCSPLSIWATEIYFTTHTRTRTRARHPHAARHTPPIHACACT